MKCAKCPLCGYFQGEGEVIEICGLFGDSWESPFQYQDKYDTTIGCYVERCYIERFAKQIDEELARMGEAIDRDIKERGKEEPLFILED